MADGMPGAPKAIIDWKKVDDLLIAGCSGREIAGYLGLNPHTIYDRCLSDHGVMFSEYSQLKYAKGESILRAHQYAKAVGKTTEGDNTLLIWLGKNRLSQKDSSELKFDSPLTVITANYSEIHDNSTSTQVPAPLVSATDSPST